MFRTLVSVVGRAMAMWRLERLLRDQELRWYMEFLGVKSSISFNDRGEPVVRLIPESGDPSVEVEVSADVLEPVYTVYAKSSWEYRHIVWTGSSAAGAAIAAAAAIDVITYSGLLFSAKDPVLS
jgi:hypothetical protein